MTSPRPRFPHYGVIGLILNLGTLGCTLYDHFQPNDVWVVHRIATYTTLLCWWGYILFLDAWIYRLQGHSLLMNRRGSFWVQVPLSISVWILFEVYNFHLRNWHYEGLTTYYLERLIGMGLAFATVIPGIFLTAEWLEVVGFARRLKIAPIRVTARISYTLFFLGLFFVIFPLLLPSEAAKYTFALVWVGFVFLLEPINHANGVPSLLKDLERGSLTRSASLFVGGSICGFWWESWNFLAPTKWVYDAPFTVGLQIFEMPMAGFLGFAPFAWELYAIYHFCRAIYHTSDRRPGGYVQMDGEPITDDRPAR
ncbi:MAG: hypothetical protein O3A46_01975 [Candidatus Poribacteria bacterium]|nr:hypothetical protein [Candidatus Poribacteria bacterium]